MKIIRNNDKVNTYKQKDDLIMRNRRYVVRNRQMDAERLRTAKIDKTTLTQKQQSNNQQNIIAHNKDAKTTLAKGKFITHEYNDQITIHGGHFIELIDTDIVSTVHPSISLVLLISGEIKFSYDNLQISLNADQHPQGVVVNLAKPANFYRAIRKDNKVSKINIALKPSWLVDRSKLFQQPEGFFALDKSHFEVQFSDELTNLVKKALDIGTPTNFKDNIELESLTQQIIADCLKQTPSVCSLNQDDGDFVGDIQIEDIVSYIEMNLNSDLSLESLSQRFSMSVSKLQRRFKQAFNLTVNGYIRFRRLEIAYQQLERGMVTITEASYEAGYQHPANFTHAFKKTFGMTPNDLVNGRGQ